MNHIKEIDGLRAIAVLSVLLFHVEYPVFGGGFVGVDVFFVISGYLITRIILFDIDAGRFSIKRFYERRIRRIAPALIATLLGCTLFLVIQPPSEAEAIRNALFSGLFSASNFLFYATTDYFSDNAYNPLLHTWSLSVEEQFYVVLPPTLLLLSRGSKARRLAAMAVMAVASLVAAEWVVRSDASAAFYLPWLRAWELLAGSLLAGSRLDRIPASLKALLTTAGVAAIFTACLSYWNRMQFPGISALLPVLGTCAVIAGTGARSPVNWALGSAPMRFIGKISYSLYLVHWPVICFVVSVQALTPKSQIAICLLSVVLAWMSWRWVENPFRETPKAAGTAKQGNRLFRNFGLIVFATSLAIVAIGWMGRSLWLSVPKALAFANYLKYQERDSQFAGNPCFLKPGAPDLDAFTAACLKIDPQRDNVLVLGDSHSVHLMTALREAHPAINFLQASASGCKPLLNAVGSDYCVVLMRYMLERWLPQSPPELSAVLISARWEIGDQAALAGTLASLGKTGKRLALFGPSPEFRARLPLLLAYEEILGRPLAARLVKTERFELDRVYRRNPALAPVFLSVIDALCPQGQCQTHAGEVPLYFDRDHLTVEGARRAVAGWKP